MTKKKEKTLLEKIFNISPKASAELEDTKLSIDGKGDEDYGANAVPEHPTVETPSEKKTPTFDEIISGIREALADPSLEEERRGSVTRAQALADSLSASAGERDGAGAKKSDEIYSLLADLCAEGMGIIMVSSEMPELLGLSDRIIVMSEGRIAGEVEAASTTQEEIMELCSRFSES